ncbi:MAG: DinB family protein [Bryobacterales bacterium]|nr:DinB family protein [Bryobacterales bacterium]
MTEPWMSGSHADVDPLLRPLLHAFDHAMLDVEKWTEGLTAGQIWAQPLGLGSIGFHLRHITGSTDRLFTYAEGAQLSETQMTALRREAEQGATRDELLAGMRDSFQSIAQKVRGLDAASLRDPRFVGRKRLPTTLHGLLVHIAEHTMRHVGELIVVARVVKAGP